MFAALGLALALSGAAAIYPQDHASGSPAEVGAARLSFTVVETNLALGAAASASSTFSGYSAGRVKDGSRDTSLGGDYSWANGLGTYPPNSPEWVQLNLFTVRNLNRAAIYTSNGYPIRDFDLQVMVGNVWVTTPLGRIRGNTSLVVNIPLYPQSAQFIRVLGISGPNHQTTYVRVNEFEVYG